MLANQRHGMLPSVGILKQRTSIDDFNVRYTYATCSDSDEPQKVKFREYTEDIVSPYANNGTQDSGNDEYMMDMMNSLGNMNINQCDCMRDNHGVNEMCDYCDNIENDDSPHSCEDSRIMHFMMEKIATLPIPLYDMDARDVDKVHGMVSRFKKNNQSQQ